MGMLWPLSPEMSTKGKCLQSFMVSEELHIIESYCAHGLNIILACIMPTQLDNM